MAETVELSEPLNDGFDQPLKNISPALKAFPGDVTQLMPKWEEIPVQFRAYKGNEWVKFVTSWFFAGWPTDRVLYTREDVDPNEALVHLSTIMRSFQPKHEHKEAAVAWLMSRWYAAIRPAEETK